jgi:signal transduction histidine kinase
LVRTLVRRRVPLVDSHCISLTVLVFFWQADSARTTRHYGGSGLGLVIARNMARLMRGDLTVTSCKGVGSTFVFAMPAIPSPEAAPGLAAEAESM